MKIEHVAFQVEDPVAVSRWYVEHLGLTVKRSQAERPFGHFLADRGDTVMLEFYNHPKATVPDYRAIDPLALHVAFLTDDVPATRARLVAAGATAEGDAQVTPTGDHVAMLRDPWGLAVQLIRRKVAMIG
jgi:glyoxylase I family protein